jgi:DNA polymerase-3 subunit delta
VNQKPKYNATQFYSELKAQNIAPVYLFYGEEDFLIKHYSERLKKAALQPGDEDFNLDILYGNDTDGATIVNTAMAFPMMAERRLVIVRDIHHLNDSGLELLAKYAEKPSPTTCLCLTTSKLNGTKSAVKKLKQFSKCIESKSLYDNQIPGWIQSHVKNRGYSISEEAATLLQINVGNSLRRLSSEVDKIELLKKEDKIISIKDIETIVGSTKEFNVFEFCDSVAARQNEKSLRIINRLLELGESPIGVIVMLTRHYTILTKTKELMAKRASKSDMAKTLKVNPYFVDKYLQQARLYSRDNLRHIFELLLRADQHLKTSYQKPKLVIESLLFEIYLLN